MIRRKIYPLQYEPSQRDFQIAAMIAEGKTLKEIGPHFQMRDHEISQLVYRMRHHFKADTSPHLVAILLRKGMIA